MDIFPSRIIKRWGLLLVLLCGTGGVLAVEPVGSPSLPFAEDLFPELEPLLQAALETGSSSQLGALTVEERRGDRDVVRAQRGPSVRFYGRFLGSYEVREDIDSVTRGDVASNLTVTQPLYRWGNLKRQQDIADEQVALAELDLERRTTQDLYAVRQAYLNVILNRERVMILEQSIDLSEGFVRARRQLVEVGQFSEQDVLEMEARVLENRERLAWSKKRLLDQVQILERLTGLRVESGSFSGSLDAIEPMPEADLAKLSDRLMGSGSDFYAEGFDARQWGMMGSIEHKRLEILEKRNWPEFDFVAGAYSDRLDAVYAQDSIFRLRSFAGLQVNWNIFDSGQSRGYKRGVLARKRAFEHRKAESLDADERRLVGLLSDLELTLAQIEARKKRESLLQRRLKLLREYAEEERVTGSELVEGEIDYLEVRQRLMEARVNYLLNLMQIALLVGEDPLLNGHF